MQSKIRVGIFVDGDFIPSYDGASNRFHYLSRHLALNGVEVIIFHGYRGWSDISLIKKEPFKTYIFPKEIYYKNLELLASLVRRENIDIIQFDNLEPILIQGIRIAQLSGAKLVSELHYVVRELAEKLGAPTSRIQEVKLIEEAVGNAVDHIICLGAHDKKILINNLRIQKNKISVISSGVDCKEIRFRGPNLQEKNIVFLGNLYFKPNEEALLKIRKIIYPKLKKFGFRFIIVGDAPHFLKKYKADDFQFLGTVNDLDVIFRKAAFAVAPIQGKTGIRIKLLNYLAAGLPIIATDDAISGIGKNNLFFVENDISKYPDLILELFENKKNLARKAKSGRRFIESAHDWNIIARRTANIYKKIISSKTKVSKSKTNSFIINSKEPVWLEEAKKKKRFKKIPSKDLRRSFSYAVIKNRGIEFFNSQQIVALEGMPCAGKSLSIDFFMKDKGSHSRVAIPQLELNVSSDAMGAGDIETSIRFLKGEKAKTDLINKLSKSYKEIILDRSFISTFAYCYARAKIEKDMNQYLHLKEEFIKMRQFITWPTKIIYFDISISESLKRRAFFGNVNANYWSDPTFLKYFKEFYEEKLEEIINLKPLKITTTDMTASEMLRKVKKLL